MPIVTINHNIIHIRPNLPLLHNKTANPYFPFNSRTVASHKHNEVKEVFQFASVRDVKTNVINAIDAYTEETFHVKAIVTAKVTTGFLANLKFTRGLDNLFDSFGKTLLLELVSAEHDGMRVKRYAHKLSKDDKVVKYGCEFEIEDSFGDVGGILVQNEHLNEMFLEDIVLDGFPNGPKLFACNSWVHPKAQNPQQRIFFATKCYLPSQTPGGLQKLREKELENLRGTGDGERKTSDRIYDYDTYNDIGNPDSNPNLARPVLGGKEHPYPRRCRTGRQRSKKDPMSELKSLSMYVPRDERFSEIRQSTFSAKTVYSVMHAVVPMLDTAVLDSDLGFPYFTAIDSLYCEGVNVPKIKLPGILRNILPTVIKIFSSFGETVLRFETPEMLERDKFAWFRDEEFARQTLAGLNPYSIKLITEWPLKSKLDPEIYGSSESAITTEMIEQQIRGFMTIDEALKNKKLFIVDYHDTFLPYVNKVREIKGTTLYGSRTVFFLMPESTLMPIAIELTRPPSEGKPQWKQAFTPSWDSTSCWLWRCAKAHMLAHDSGYHQLISHWLRTHCCVEPYIIATNRQLSAMHPIYALLNPHFRFTMEINKLARESLINAGGIIETSFSPGKYSMEMSSAIYDQEWRFDNEALPADLISRGLAVENPNSPHGLKLTIQDYPFANDGLILYDTIKEWVADYVTHYYPEPSLINSDQELQLWWAEIRTKGHEDKKDEPWWPVLNTPEDLIQILTTMIWVASGHHAAVNFGQYHFAGYFPNRPTIARTNMPTEGTSDESWKFFLEKPEIVLLKCFPSQIQATKIMALLDVLSNHSPDEEYLGEKAEPSWQEDEVVKAAFERFAGRLKVLEGIVDDRNANRDLKNRHGAGVVPYELLKPFSKPGVTGMGVPNSISI